MAAFRHQATARRVARDGGGRAAAPRAADESLMRGAPVAAAMAYPGASPDAESAPAAARLLRSSGARLADAYARIARAVEAYPLERIALGAILVGVLLRLAVPFLMDFRSDGDTYVAMGHAWLQHRAFLMPWGDVTTWAPASPEPSHHYPPAYPFFLGLVFLVFGYGLWQAKWAAVVVSLAALGAAFATTKDLYGKRAALLVTGLLALEPHLLWVTGTGFSENMVLLFFALTMWAILRGLVDERFIVLAGLFAGLAYLSRSSVGYFFFVAGIGGFLWRFYYQRWRLFTNVWYMGAVAVFGSIVLAWAARNVSLFGYAREVIPVPFVGGVAVDMPQWETSSYVKWVQNWAWQHPEDWLYALRKKLPLFLLFFAWWALPFLPETLRGLRRAREEHTSALVLSVFLVWLLAWAISAMFWTYERSWIYWLDNHRYVLIGLLPLGWLVLREARTDRASFRLRYGLLAVGLLAMCAATVLSPVKFTDLRAAEALDPHLMPGDEIAVDGGTIKYAFYAYLSDPSEVTIYGCEMEPPECAREGRSPHFIVSLQASSYDGYVLMGTYSQRFWNGGVMTAWLLAREDVQQERGLFTGAVEARS
jgi:4-amino-4-deoxy-L-arabinose transferase-like glycosyltransferase